jgi:hypothetical protein
MSENRLVARIQKRVEPPEKMEPIEPSSSDIVSAGIAMHGRGFLPLVRQDLAEALAGFQADPEANSADGRERIRDAQQKLANIDQMLAEKPLPPSVKARSDLLERLQWIDGEYPDLDDHTAARKLIATAQAYSDHIEHLDPVADRETIDAGNAVIKIINPDFDPEENHE